MVAREGSAVIDRATELSADRLGAMLRRHSICGSLQQFFEGRVRFYTKRSGPGIMFSGEFFRARLRGDENDRKIKMRIGVVRIVGESLKDLRLRLFLSPFLAGGDTEIIVSGSAFGVYRDRLR